MTTYKTPSRLLLLTTVFSLGLSLSAFADFTVQNGETVNNTQTLNGDYLTGVVQETGKIVIFVKNDDGIEVIGNYNSVTSRGDISTTQNGSSGLHNKANNSTLESYGKITTQGNNAGGFLNYRNLSSELKNYGEISTIDYNSDGFYNTFSDGAKLLNYSEILTLGGNSNGIQSNNGIDVIMENYGQIITHGSGATGLYNNSADNVTIKNFGDITTYASSSDGIEQVGGNNSVIVNEGNITSYANGIYNRHGNNANIKNSKTGVITAKIGAGADGIYNYYSINVNIVNEGTIITNDNVAHGIINSSNSNNTNITSSGNILTKGIRSRGILNAGSNVNILNTGEIRTLGEDAYGIYNTSGDDSTVNNEKNIFTFGEGAFGINNALSDDAIIINSGLIETEGEFSLGLYDFTSNNTAVKNYNKINVLGEFSDGMHFLNSNNATILNEGLINVEQQGNGMYIQNSDNLTITNTGIIQSSDGMAMRIDTSDSVITNNGTIKAKPENNAIYLYGNNNQIILQSSSTIIGKVIIVGTGNIVEYSVSRRFGEGGGLVIANEGKPDLSQFSGDFTVNEIFSGYIFPTSQGRVVTGTDGNVYAVTPDSVAGAQGGITTASIQSGNVVTQRQQLALLGKTTGIPTGTMMASDASSMNDIDPAAGWGFKENDVFWVEGFGSYRERPEDGDSAFSRARSAGTLVGVDFAANDETLRSGIYGGAFTARQNLGKVTFREIQSEGLLLGGYVGKSFLSFYGSLGLALGYAQNESDRYVGGQIANAGYDTFFVSPSLTLMKPIYGEQSDWVPSLTVRYTGQFTEEYTESGSAVPQNIKYSDTHALSARAQLEGHLEAVQVGEGMLSPTLRFGVDGQTALGPTTVDLSVLGTDMSFDPKGGDNYVDGFAGLNLSYMLEDDVEMYMDTEVQAGINKGNQHDNFGVNLRLGARWQF